MKPQSNGLFSPKQVKESGLPVFDFVVDVDSPCPVDYWTYSDMKRILLINLNDEQRETMIVGFVKTSSRMKGYAALYSLSQCARALLDIDIKYNPSGD